jgi:SAM-dependent methyltransferase
MNETSKQHKAAWEYDAYGFWVRQTGTPQERAAKDKANPAGMLGKYAAYFDRYDGVRIANICGSCGKKAIPLALLGADVTIFDISEDNRRYALETAEAAGTRISYVVGDVMEIDPEAYSGYFDVVFMEGGILHYFHNISEFMRVMYEILRPGGKMICSDFHPFNKIADSLHFETPTMSYFSTDVFEGEMAHARFYEEPVRSRIPKCLYRKYTISEIINAIIAAGFCLKRFDEHPSWEDEKLPGEFTAVAVRKPQPDDDGKEIIGKFVSRSVEILEKKLTGIYLHGSAAMGCYQPKKSDLDFVVVVEEAMTETEKRAYMDMVIALDADGPAKGIEMSVVTRDACDPFVYPTPFILHWSRMHAEWYRKDPDDYIRKMNGTDRDLAAHFTVIRSRGICLYGLPAGEVFGEVPEQDYLDSIRDDIAEAAEQIADHPMYYILNLARVLGYLRGKKVLSKKEGGIWGLKNLPEKYHPLIRAALDEYGNGTETRYDTMQARDYADYMLGRINSRQAQGY